MASDTTDPGFVAGDEGSRRPPRRSRLPGYLGTALGLILLIAILGGLKGAQIAKLIGFGKRAQAAGPPPETVNTYVANEQSWEQTLRSVGSVAAARGVSISNDAAGIVWRLHFESGATVREGQVLVELDTRVEQAQLASAQARTKLAATNLGRTRSLVQSGAVGEAQLDSDSAALAGARADAEALAQQIERKTVRAPFAGKLGIRLVNVGQYLPPGTPITVLESSEATYVDFDLPQEELPRLAVGMPVRLTLGGGQPGGPAQSAEGSIAAVAPQVTASTRSIDVRASVPASAGWLKPGMFVEVAVIEQAKESVVAVPETAVVHASYGDSVFVVEDAPGKGGGPEGKVARQQFVQLGPTRGDFVAVSKGIRAGDTVVSAGAFKLRNGLRVTVSNAVEAKPELEPRPPNR
ncbi:MAG: efflux RND transporter periplasmic adaptor subunit [Polyangiaceae bacterium]